MSKNLSRKGGFFGSRSRKRQSMSNRGLQVDKRNVASSKGDAIRKLNNAYAQFQGSGDQTTSPELKNLLKNVVLTLNHFAPNRSSSSLKVFKRYSSNKARKARNLASRGARYVSNRASRGARYVSNKASRGARYASNRAARGARYVSRKAGNAKRYASRGVARGLRGVADRLNPSQRPVNLRTNSGNLGVLEPGAYISPPRDPYAVTYPDNYL